MAIAVLSEPTVATEADAPAVLTPRGRAAARLLAFEDAWAELDGADRAYFAGTLEQLAREATLAGEREEPWTN